MDNYDPFKAVHQLRAWIKQTVSAANESASADARKRYGRITRVIEQLQGLDISVPEDLISEKRAIEEFIAASRETKSLTKLADELSILAREVDRHLRSLETKRSKAPAQKLRVRFPDGTVIFENKAVETFVKSIQYVGLERVSELTSIKSHGGHPIVSRRKNESAGMVREINGYYIETKSSTERKARHIREIARELSVEISVECVD